MKTVFVGMLLLALAASLFTVYELEMELHVLKGKQGL